MSRSVPSLLHQWLVELAACPRVDGCPAVLTVVLQTGHVGAEEGGKLSPTPSALTLVAQLVIQDIWLHFHLTEETEDGKEKYQNGGREIFQSMNCKMVQIILFSKLMVSSPKNYTHIRILFRDITKSLVQVC